MGLPDLQISAIKAKIDSGARTSALHAEDVRYLQKANKTLVSFRVYPDQKLKTRSNQVEAEVLEEREVRSSTGHTSLRPVVITHLKLGKRIWPIEVTLVDRDIMGFRMLIGREAIRERFLIDPGRSFLFGRFGPKRKKMEESSP